jgi:hypothetical protein
MDGGARKGRVNLDTPLRANARRAGGRFHVTEPPAHWRIFAMIEICPWEASMNGIIYLIGLVVVVMAVLSLIGLR